jgi:hypothetical protein
MNHPARRRSKGLTIFQLSFAGPSVHLAKLVLGCGSNNGLLRPFLDCRASDKSILRRRQQYLGIACLVVSKAWSLNQRRTGPLSNSIVNIGVSSTETDEGRSEVSSMHISICPSYDSQTHLLTVQQDLSYLDGQSHHFGWISTMRQKEVRID